MVWRNSTEHGFSINPFRQPKTWNLAAANVMGALLTIQLMAPCFKPLGIWFGKGRIEGDITFPWMIELFSRIPDALALKGKTHLTPIPVDEELSSLSAILLDEAYYSFIHDSKMEKGGFTVVPPECLVPLKAKAWLNLTALRDVGQKIDKNDIKKHKNDIFRLFQIIEPDKRLALPGLIGQDLDRFLREVEADPPLSLKPFGLMGTAIGQVIGTLREIYGLSS
jgi:hypothetical protein